MGEGGGGRSSLSLFRFHLSPFPPETPDTHAKLSNSQVMHQSIPPTPSPHPRANAGHLPALSVPGVGHLQLLHCPGAGHLPTIGPFPSF